MYSSCIYAIPVQKNCETFKKWKNCFFLLKEFIYFFAEIIFYGIFWCEFQFCDLAKNLQTLQTLGKLWALLKKNSKHKKQFKNKIYQQLDL